MKSGVKLRGHLGVVVKILELIAKDPAQRQRELVRDREFVRMALSAQNGVTEAIATVTRHSELWTIASEPVSYFKGSTAEYVFALAADGLKGLRDHHGQIRDGRLLPALTPEQILFLNQIDVQGATAIDREAFLRASSRRATRPLRLKQQARVGARPSVGVGALSTNAGAKRSGGG